jgi:hypothetical protein
MELVWRTHGEFGTTTGVVALKVGA